jgi:hypothetical protein
MSERSSRYRRLRWLILPVVLVLLAILVPALVPTDVLRARLAGEIAKATGAEVALGEASFRLLPRPGVALDGGTIRGTGPALAAATGKPNQLVDYAVDLDRFDATLALGPLVKGRFEIAGVEWTGPGLVVRWNDGDLRAEAYRLRLDRLTLGLGGSDRGTAPGDHIPADLTCDVRVRAARLVAAGLDLTDLETAGRFADRALDFSHLRAVLGPGEVRGTAVLDYGADPDGSLAFDLEFDGIPAPTLFGPWWPDLAARLECVLAAEVTGSLDLRDPATRRNTLQARGTVRAGPGVLAARDWLHEATPYLGDRQDLKTVRFEALRHEFELAGGRYLVKDIALTGGESEWRGTGWVALAGNLDLAWRVRLPAGFTPDLGNWSFLAEGLRDPDGRVNLAFRLNGPTRRPDFAVDLAGLLGKNGGRR